MAQELTLYRKCSQCNGTGTFQSAHGEGSSSGLCNWPGCENGYMFLAKITLNPGIDDVIDNCQDILDKCNDILDKLDS